MRKEEEEEASWRIYVLQEEEEEGVRWHAAGKKRTRRGAVFEGGSGRVGAKSSAGRRSGRAPERVLLAGGGRRAHWRINLAGGGTVCGRRREKKAE